MTKKSFQKQTIRWSDIGKHQDNDFIYRGQRCADWHLETSLERTCMKLHRTLGKAHEMERILFREFRRRFHHYSPNVPAATQYLRWFSLMQHHGAPTRLLDCTFSIYVAAYFALEHAPHNCAIWKINKKWLNDEGRKLFQRISRPTDIFEIGNDEKEEDYFKNAVLDRESIAAVIQVGPFELDERLTIQKGVFLYPCHANQTFEANLKVMPGASDPSHVLKLTIERKEHRGALKMLHSMNISRATLFPGLDGFAQSLKVYHPLL